MDCPLSSTYAEPLDLVERGLDDLAVIDPGYRTTGEKKQFLVGISRLISRAEAERLRVLAVSDDIAEETGDRSTATWLAPQTRDAHGTVRRNAVLASALESRWNQTAEALGAGEVNLAQGQVIVEALAALPQDLGDDLLVKARPTWSRRPPTWDLASCATSAAGSSSTWPPSSPRRRTASGC